MKKSILIPAILLLVSTLSMAGTPTLIGLRGGYYTDLEKPYIGGGFRTGLSRALDINPNLEYVLVDGGSYMTINIDLLYTITANRHNYAWLGTGLAISKFDPEGDMEGDSDTGFNFIFGYGFMMRTMVPYLQAKIITGNYDDVVIGGGLLFRL